MNRRHAVLLLCLALTAVQGYALEPKAPPSPTSDAPATHSLTPNKENLGENIFVGHFGETVRLAQFWSADASMQGPMEVVNFHLTNIDPLELISPPFNPSKKDYVPQNFARLRLMQMLVIPKNVPGGFESLKKLREAKTKELGTNGITQTILDLGESSWPPDSFQVLTSTPYQLFQIYTQSDKNFFIVTSGTTPYVLKSGDPILTNATIRLTDSLSTHLEGFPWKHPPAPDAESGLPGALSRGAAVCIVGALLGCLPKRRKWVGRLRSIGRATLGFTLGYHIFAVPLLYAAWRLDLGRTLNQVTIALGAGLLTPWLSRAISVRMGGQRPWRVFFGSAAVCLLPIISYYSFIANFQASIFVLDGESFERLSHIFSILGAMNGAAFGLTHYTPEDGQ